MDSDQEYIKLELGALCFMISDQELVEVFRKTRHDWLNYLQLIKANLSLNRLDRIETLINQIVEESQNESNLSNLKAVKMTAFLLLQKSLNTNYQLHIHVDPMSLDLSEKDEEITTRLETLFYMVKAELPPSTLYLDIKKRNEGLQLHLRIPIENKSRQQFQEKFNDRDIKLPEMCKIEFEEECLHFTIVGTF